MPISTSTPNTTVRTRPGPSTGPSSNSSPTYLEENRFLYVDSALGRNRLLLESFTGTEGISRLFSFELDLLSENRAIPFESILGQEISFGVLGPEGSEPRHMHGIVTAFRQLPESPRLARYRAVVAPKLWLLTCRQNCRIFQQLTVPDILAKLFSGLDVVWELSGAHDPRDYCVQYHETDFQFASRLMEEEGIFYFFRFTRGAHHLVVADSPSSHRDIPGGSSLSYEEVSGGLRDEARIRAWVKSQDLGPSRYTLQDYCFGIPYTNLMVSAPILDSVQVGKVSHKLRVGGNDQLEIYDYPGGYGIRAQDGGSRIRPHGEAIVKTGMEYMEMAQFAIGGESNICGLIPGCRFKLTRHPHADGSYVLTFVTHTASEGGFHSAEDIGKNHYDNRFQVIPAALPFRPPRATPKPRAWGCQTAVVVGAAGEEIYTDKYGRIKVQFHWDREGKNDAASSCWIRVATPWAGHQWGSVHIPRIGQEVIVDFLEGDPDCPIVVGSVYNGQNGPPYALPDERTKSTVKSMSSKGGGGFNELRFEDKKGSEQVFLHAEKNLDVRVKAKQYVTVGDESHWQVAKDQLTEIGGDLQLTIKGDRNEKAGGTVSLNAGQDLQTKVGMNYALQSGTEVHLKAGMNLVLESGTTLTLKVGGNFINLNPAGVFISGTMVMINSGGAAGSGSGCSPQSPKAPAEADKAQPGQAAAPQPPAPAKPGAYSPAAMVLKQAAVGGTPFCEL